MTKPAWTDAMDAQGPLDGDAGRSVMGGTKCLGHGALSGICRVGSGWELFGTKPSTSIVAGPNMPEAGQGRRSTRLEPSLGFESPRGVETHFQLACANCR